MIDKTGQNEPFPVGTEKLLSILSHAFCGRFGDEVKGLAQQMYEASKGGYILKVSSGKQTPFPMAQAKQVPVEAIMPPLRIPIKL